MIKISRFSVSRAFSLTLCACALIGLVPIAGNAQKLKSGVKSWSGKPVLAKNGDFRYCYTTRTSDPGQRLSVAINKTGQLELWVRNDGLILDSGTEYLAFFQVDHRKAYRGTARVFPKDELRVRIKRSKSLFRDLRAGRILKVNAAGRPMRFGLRGSSAALSDLYDCFDASSEAQTAIAPPVENSKGGNQKTASFNRFTPLAENREPRRKSDFHEDRIARKFAREALRYAEGRDIRVLPKPPFILTYLQPAIAWESRHGFGVASFEDIILNRAKLRSTLIRSDKKHCRDWFSSQILTRDLDYDENEKLYTVYTNCDGIGTNPRYFVTYSFYPLRGDGYVRVAHISRNMRRTQWADDRFYEAANEYLSER